MKRCVLLLVALATIPSTFALPPGEFPIAPLPKGAAPYERRQPEVAANENLFLAVWEDARVVPNQPLLWAARVNREGALLDQTGIMVATFAPNSLIGTHLRSVATDGTDFIVAWSDDQDRLVLTKITADGKVIPLPDPNMRPDAATIVWLGDVYAIFAIDPSPFPSGAGDVVVATVDPDGKVLAPARVGLGGVQSISTAINADKSIVYLAWLAVDDATVHVAPIFSQQIRNRSITPPPAGASGPNGRPRKLSIASNGGDILAAWLDVEPTPDVYRARLFDSSGTPQGPLVTFANASEFSVRPTVVWNGAEYVVTYKDADKSARLVRFADNGTLLGPPHIISSDVADVTIGTFIGIDVSLVVWNEQRGSSQEVYANLLLPGTPAFRLAPPPILSGSFADRSDAIVFWRGDHYLAAWRDVSDFSRAVVGRFTAEGQPLDGTGISTGYSAAPPALASNGRTAVVAWLDLNGVASSFIDEAGHVARRSFDFPGGPPAVQWNGEQYLVAWVAPGGQLLGLRMTGAGVLLDNQAVTIGPITGSQPFIGWTGNSYVVVSAENAPCVPGCGNQTTTLWAQFVSPNLTPIGGRIQLSEERVGTPAIADGPAGTLVIWPRTVGNSTTLRGVRVVNGAILDSLNGFELGAGTHASVYPFAGGWGVVSGPYLWTVSKNGAVTPRVLAFPFVPAGAHSSVVFGGPKPLVVYRREPVGSEQMMQVVARYFTEVGRHRGVRH